MEDVGTFGYLYSEESEIDTAIGAVFDEVGM